MKRCDRILWKGEGVKQIWYERGESRFSDHRPVYSLFAVQLMDPTAKARNVCAKSNNIDPTLLLTSLQSCLDTTVT